MAIWIYKPYRGKGYGTEAFNLAMEYCFAKYNLIEIVAGCYQDNIKSSNMLKKIDFLRNEKDDSTEKDIFTGRNTKQLAFRITYDDYNKIRKSTLK